MPSFRVLKMLAYLIQAIALPFARPIVLQQFTFAPRVSVERMPKRIMRE